MTASVPELEKRTSSAAGTIFEMRSATLSSRSVDKRKHAADLHAFARRRIDPRIGVAEDRRAIAHAVIDVLVVVEIDDARALAVLHVDRAILAPVAEIGSDAERQPLDGALKVRVVVGQFSGHGVPLELIRLIGYFARP